MRIEEAATSEACFGASESLASINRHLTGQMDQWAAVDACPACHVSGVRAFAELRSIAYSRCPSCGFVFANPRPPDEVLGAFYNSSFYGNYRALEAARRRTEPYFSVSAYMDQRVLAQWLLESRPTSVLDFGCGPGAFLALLRDEYGVTATEGLELNEASIAVAKRSYDLEIVSDRRALAQDRYDAVLLLEVIEHITDVDAVMADIASLVRPGGHLLLTTPAVEGFVARRLPRQCLHYSGPSHVSMFTRLAIEALLQRHGFTIEDSRTDPAGGIATATIRGLLYGLDFRSPGDADDTNDAWWEPTALGRRLGLRAGREATLPRLLSRLCGIGDRAIDRGLQAAGRTKPDHLYVLARRADAPSKDT